MVDFGSTTFPLIFLRRRKINTFRRSRKRSEPHTRQQVTRKNRDCTCVFNQHFVTIDFSPLAHFVAIKTPCPLLTSGRDSCRKPLPARPRQSTTNQRGSKQPKIHLPFASEVIPLPPVPARTASALIYHHNQLAKEQGVIFANRKYTHVHYQSPGRIFQPVTEISSLK